MLWNLTNQLASLSTTLQLNVPPIPNKALAFFKSTYGAFLSNPPITNRWDVEKDT
jgi:hypothetical protein